VRYDSEDDLSPGERRALAAWRAPEPPADLAERVVARVVAERLSRGAARPVALAALAAAVVSGLFALRLLAGAAPSGASEARLLGGGGDGGGAAETSGLADGRGG
jgi:hypothetical protein